MKILAKLLWWKKKKREKPPGVIECPKCGKDTSSWQTYADRSTLCLKCAVG